MITTDAAIALGTSRRMLATVRNVAVVRLLAVALAIGGTVTYPSFPDGREVVLLALTSILGLGGLAQLLLARGVPTIPVRVLAWSSVVFDVLISSAFVWAFSFDPTSALFATFFVVVIEAALFFELRGALVAWVVLTGIFVLREAVATGDQRFHVDKVIVRMGLVLLVAWIVGRATMDLRQERERTQAALDEAQRVGLWRSRLVAMLAHDIRSPLAAISAGITTLDHNLDQVSTDQAHDILRASARRADRLGVLARDLLDLARAEEGQLTVELAPVDLREVVDDALLLLGSPAADVGVDIPDGLAAMADPARLEQVVSNLLVNAFRHGRPPVHVTARDEGDAVVVRVLDHGDGLAPEVEETLFTAFGGAHSANSVGLGLWVVRQLVEAMGGEVGHEPGPQGPTFWLRLPQAQLVPVSSSVPVRGGPGPGPR